MITGLGSFKYDTLKAMKKTLFMVFVACFLTTACRQKDVRTGVIVAPEMKNQACSQIVTEAIARQQGVLRETIEVNAEKRKSLLGTTACSWP